MKRSRSVELTVLAVAAASLKNQTFVVGFLLNTVVFYSVFYITNWREDSINRNNTMSSISRLIFVSWNISTTFFDSNF